MLRAMRLCADPEAVKYILWWNITPNDDYVLKYVHNTRFELWDAAITTLRGVATGVASAERLRFEPQNGFNLGFFDPDLMYHVRLTTEAAYGSESWSVRVGRFVDLPDIIHPIYVDFNTYASHENLPKLRAKHELYNATHIVNDISFLVPQYRAINPGDYAVLPVDGEEISTQVETVTYTGGPDGMTTTVTARNYTTLCPYPPDDMPI